MCQVCVWHRGIVSFHIHNSCPHFTDEETETLCPVTSPVAQLTSLLCVTWVTKAHLPELLFYFHLQDGKAELSVSGS